MQRIGPRKAWQTLARHIIKFGILDNDQEYFKSREYELHAALANMDNLTVNLEPDPEREFYETHTADEIRKITGRSRTAIYNYAGLRGWHTKGALKK